MKRRKQIGKLIYTPRWGQGDIELSQDYGGLSRDEKLDVLSDWINELLSIRNAMIPNPQSWHHFTGDKSWVELTDREMMDAIYIDDTPMEMGRKIEAKLKEKNT
jgi:hypothetical protein